MSRKHKKANAYILWFQIHHNTRLVRTGANMSQRDVVKKAGEVWRALPRREKRVSMTGIYLIFI